MKGIIGLSYYEELGLLLYNGDKETVSGTLEITGSIFFPGFCAFWIAYYTNQSRKRQDNQVIRSIKDSSMLPIKQKLGWLQGELISRGYQRGERRMMEMNITYSIMHKYISLLLVLWNGLPTLSSLLQQY